MSKKFTPYPYQQKIIDFIATHKRCAIWASMGLGKTVSTLTAIKPFLEKGEKALIIAPKRVATSVWAQECEKWDHLKRLKVAIVVGSAQKVNEALDSEANVYVTNYERIAYIVQKFGRQYPFSITICDEASRLRGFKLRQGTKCSRELGRVAHLYCTRFIELTGTPAANNYLPLWAQMWFLDHGAALGRSYSEYLERYFMAKKLGFNAFAIKYELLPFAEETIKEKIKPCVITINTEDYFKLDEPIVTSINVDLPMKAKKIYRDMERDLFAELESGEEVESPNAAVKVMKCLQIASGAIYKDDGEYEVIHDEKLKALESILEEAAGEPILVAYQFRHELERIKKYFKEARCLESNPNKANKTIEEWNQGKIPMLCVQQSSSAYGLNLAEGGNRLVFFSLGWDLETHLQMIERIGPVRQKQSGHPRPVYVYNILANGTLDFAVQERLKTKKDLQDILLERGENDA